MDAAWLAAVRRDLRAIRSPYRLALMRESRILRRHGAFDDAWFAEREARVEELSAWLASPGVSGASAGRRQARILGHEVLDLVAAVHGDVSARNLEALAGAAWEAWFGADALQARLNAMRRVRRASDQPGPHRSFTWAMAVDRAKAIVLCPGPGQVDAELRDERLRRASLLLLAWPFDLQRLGLREQRGTEPLPRRWEQAVQRAGEEAKALLAAGRSAPLREALAGALGCAGLLFRCDGPTPPELDEVVPVLSAWPAPGYLPALRRVPLRLGDALRLGGFVAEARPDAAVLERCARLVAHGFGVERLPALVRKGKCGLEHLLELDDADSLRAWAEWWSRLEPTYRRRGLELELPPGAFAGVKGERGAELAALAQCLFEWTRSPERRNPEWTTLVLDLSLSLTRHPEPSAGLAAAVASGEGAPVPEPLRAFAAWLGDDVALRELLRLQALAGEPAVPSRLLRGDFDAEQRLRRQVEYLGASAAPTPAQRRRLAALEARLASGALPGPARTRRRLAIAVDAVRARAVQHQLERCAREAIARRWGAAPEVMTPAWLDAARYLLLADEHRALLERVVRFAAAHPGQPIVRELPANTAWLARAAARMDADAWLAHHSWTVELDGRPHVLSTEEDPIESLRMGVPFHTCLTIETNHCERSPVLNAIDANKRVLYLRDARGAIVARKLVAISSAGQLVGYRVYSCLGPARQEVIERAFTRACTELAQAARLELANTGTPERIHPGVWYDDGVVPWAGADALAELCGHLGRPRVRDRRLRAEAVGWLARRRGDVESAIASFDPDPLSEGALEQGEWIVEQLGFDRALHRARTTPALYAPLFRRVAQGGTPAVLDLLERTGGAEQASWQTCFWLWQWPGSPGTALRLANVAARSARRKEGPRRNGMEYISRFLVSMLISADPVAQIFDVCDVLAPAWEAHARRWPEERTDWRRGLSGAVVAYFERPDPLAVVRCLESPRRSDVAIRTALDVAALFTVPVELRGRLLAALGAFARRRPDMEQERGFSQALVLAEGRAGAGSRGRLLEVLSDPGVPEKTARDALDLFCRGDQDEDAAAVAIRGYVERGGRPLPAIDSLQKVVCEWDTRELGALRHVWALPGLRDALAASFCNDASDGGLEEFCAVVTGPGEPATAFVREVFQRSQPRFLYDIVTPWIRQLALEVALEQGPLACLNALWAVPDAFGTSAFIDRIVARYPQPDPPLELDDWSAHVWLREAWARVAARRPECHRPASGQNP